MRGYADRLHGRIAVSAAAKPLHRPLLPGRLQGHPQRRRRRPLPAAPCRSPAGRTGRATSCSSAASSRARACSTCSRPTGSCARPAATAGCSSSARGPQEREARRYVATRRLRGVEFLGRVSDEEKAQLFRTADVYVSPATGGESFGIVLLEAMAAGDRRSSRSDIHGYKGVVRRGAQGLLVPPRKPKAIAAAVGAAPRRRRAARRRWARAGARAAEEFSWARVTAKVEDYYGFVIRRLAAGGELPPELPRPDPAVPAALEPAAVPPRRRAGPPRPRRSARSPARSSRTRRRLTAVRAALSRRARAAPAPARSRAPARGASSRVRQDDPPDQARSATTTATRTRARPTTAREAGSAEKMLGTLAADGVFTGNWNGYR